VAGHFQAQRDKTVGNRQQLHVKRKKRSLKVLFKNEQRLKMRIAIFANEFMRS